MSTIEDRARKLRERTQEDYPAAWDFKEIPNVTGIVESIREAVGPLGKRIVVQVAEVEGPEDARKRYAIWLSQRALYNQFVELRVAVGELVSVTYLGQSDHAEPGQSPPHRFRVEVDRDAGGFAWPGEPTPDATRPAGDELSPDEARWEHEQAVDAAAAALNDDRPAPSDDDIPY